MLQIVNPTLVHTKELKNLNLEIRYYEEYTPSVQVLLFEKSKAGYMVYSRSYNEYSETAKRELDSFVENYNNKIEDKKIADCMKLYMELCRNI